MDNLKVIGIVAVVVILAGAGIGAIFLMNNNEDKIIIATSPDFAPYDDMDGQTFTGIDMDVCRAIFDHQLNGKYKYEFKSVAFGGIITGVRQGTYDMGASGFTITEDRKQNVRFSESYATANQVVLVKSGADAVNSSTDLNGKMVGVQTGTTGDSYVTDKLKLSEDNIKRCDYYTDLYQLLQNGTIKAIVMDDKPALAYQKVNSALVDLYDTLGSEVEEYAFIFNKGNTAFADEVSAALTELKASGEVQRIIDYYAANNYAPGTPSYYKNHQFGPSSNRFLSALGGSVQDNVDGSTVEVANTELGYAHSSISLYDAEGVTDNQSKGSFINDIQESFQKDFVNKDRYKYVVTGLTNTLKITFIALIVGVLLGSLVSIVRTLHDKQGKLPVSNAVCKLYVTVIRGTPVLVQLLIIYYVVFATSRFNDIFIAGIAFGINSGAYVAEIIRAGINAVPKGQFEACAGLGMPFRMMMFLVILPQAIRNILPALCNEGISLLKETSISGYIGVMDLTRAGDIIRSQTYDALFPLLVIAGIYLVMVLALTKAVGVLERRLNSAY